MIPFCAAASACRFAVRLASLGTSGPDAAAQRLGENLSGMNIPVLRKTAQDIQRLRGKQESVTARDLSQIVLRDPLMTLKVLRFSQSRLTRRQATEVTTVEHALMMHGLTSFFREMGALTELEQQLAAQPEALEGALRVISRACHAATNARNFGAIRHDMDSDEVVTGACCMTSRSFCCGWPPRRKRSRSNT